MSDSPETQDFREDNRDERNRPPARRGRKPGKRSGKSDMKVKLERSRQSARECRARKKLRYQYLEDQASIAEKSVLSLQKEMENCAEWAREFDAGRMPEGLVKLLEQAQRGDDNLPDGKHSPHCP